MKLLFDQNLSHRLATRLAAEFPGSTHVRNVGLQFAADPIIWHYAKEHGFVIVSKDTDFEQRALLRGHPPKVIWLRVGNCSTAEVEALMHRRMSDILEFNEDEGASLLALG